MNTPTDTSLDWLFGSMPADPGFDEAIAEISMVDAELWETKSDRVLASTHNQLT